jgi:hypothetical protein
MQDGESGWKWLFVADMEVEEEDEAKTGCLRLMGRGTNRAVRDRRSL